MYILCNKYARKGNFNPDSISYEQCLDFIQFCEIVKIIILNMLNILFARSVKYSVFYFNMKIQCIKRLEKMTISTLSFTCLFTFYCAVDLLRNKLIF
jgi:hypothetical protein